LQETESKTPTGGKCWSMIIIKMGLYPAC